MLDYCSIADEVPNHLFLTPPQPVGWWVFPGGSMAGTTKIACYVLPEQHIIDNMLSMLGFKYESNT